MSSLRSDDSPAAQLADTIAESALDHIERPDAEHHVGLKVRLARDEVADDVGPHHLLVHGVGFDVLAEADARFRRVHPVQSVDQSARSRRGRDLGCGEVTDRGAAQIAMQAEERHQVDRCQRLRGHVIEVVQIRRVQPAAVIRSVYSF